VPSHYKSRRRAAATPIRTVQKPRIAIGKQCQTPHQFGYHHQVIHLDLKLDKSLPAKISLILKLLWYLHEHPKEFQLMKKQYLYTLLTKKAKREGQQG
jgi:hypothetical protein